MQRLILLFLFIGKLIYVQSQCSPTEPAIGTCSGGDGAGSNGVNINTGQTYWFDGGPSTWTSGINLNGGTFRVCGDLTLSSLSFNSGIIIIESGGSLTINAGSDLYLNGNSGISNRGTLNINSNLRLQNTNNTLWNISSGASFNVSGLIELNSSTSKLINNGGSISASSILVQSSANTSAVCMQDGACFNFNNITNNYENTWVFSGSGNAVINYTDNAELNEDLTASSDVIVCMGSGTSTTGGAGWGAATISNTSCPDCNISLPIELLSFEAKYISNSVLLTWETATEINNDYFNVERSYDGENFATIATIKGAGNSNKTISYSFEDKDMSKSTCYYRLKQTDNDGTFTYSKIEVISFNEDANPLEIYPNPNQGKFIIKGRDNIGQIIIFNTQGEKVRSFQKNEEYTQVDLRDLAKGIYFIHVLGIEEIFVRKILIE